MKLTSSIVLATDQKDFAEKVKEILTSSRGITLSNTCRGISELKIQLESTLASVAIVDIDSNTEKTLSELDRLVPLYPNTRFAVASSASGKDIIIEAMQSGARYFMNKKSIDVELDRVLEKIIFDSAKALSAHGQVISVLSAGGGCGATTIALNLANELRLKASTPILAIDLDENYALAWAGLADCYLMTADYMYVTSKDSIRYYFQKAKDAAINALEFDPSLSEAFATLAYIKLIYEWDWYGAVKDFERAIELNPYYGTAHQWYANVLTVLNQHDKAIAEAKLAQQIDPLSPIINRNVGRRLYFAHQYEQAIEASLNALSIKPDFFPALWTLSLSYLQNKNYSKAIQEMQRAVKYSGDDLFVKALLGYVYGTAGEQGEAQVILNELNETSKYQKIPGIAFAVIYIGLGENDNAMNWLEKAYEERSNHLIYLNSNPIFDPIRSEPRFIELVKKMNFPNSSRS